MCRSPAGVVDFSTSSRRVPGRASGPQWTVSRVLFRRAVTRASARTIHLGDALLRRSSALPGHRARRTGHLDGPSWMRCPYLSLLREGLAAPPVTRLSRVGSYPTISPLPVPPPRALSRSAGARRPSAVLFLLRFPSGHPGSPLTTSPPCGARTFLPRWRRSHGAPPAILHPPPAGGILGALADCGQPGRTARRLSCRDVSGHNHYLFAIIVSIS